MNLEITLKQALLGFKKSFMHLDGHEVMIEQKGVTKPNFVKRILGEGMPVRQTPSEKGSLYIKFLVRLPRRVSNAQMEILKKIYKA